MQWGRALDAAIAAARIAGDRLRRDFHRPGGPRGHADKAEADVEAELEIRGRLLAAFPEWGYLGEETGRVGGEPGQPVWLVDPNDGTRDYLKGRRGSAVSIGLAHEGRAVLGVVFAFGYPDDSGDLFAWAEGCGPLRRNGRAVERLLAASLAADDVVLVSSAADRDPEANLRCSAPARYRALPSVAHRLALAAAGEGGGVVSLFAPSAWDYAGGQALLRAAGGVLVNESGEDVAYSGDGSSSTLRAFGGSRGVARLLSERDWQTLGDGGSGAPSKLTRLRRGQAVADAGLLSRAQGCLLGQIAGDSLGGLVEFDRAEQVAARYTDGPRLLEDGGHWDILAGQPTDDSEMALTLARSIVEADGYRAETALRDYRLWYRSAPFDIGATTRAALVGYLMAESQANGSLMRASPLGILGHAWDPARVADLAAQDSALTHPNPICVASVQAFTVAVSHAIGHGDGPRRAYDAALAWARRADVPAAVVRALEAADGEPPVCDSGNVGWVLLALQNAFHALLRSASLEEGVVATVRRGGDTDTNAAIAGALLGAVHGRDAIPEQWRVMVLSCRPHSLKGRRPRPVAFWPVDALELAERLLISGRGS